ncbi:MAG: hypothetical protein JWQ97_3471 [Phenylobacterium sp.]|nr:hypothetical protein [Phenylobacterium sp.]
MVNGPWEAIAWLISMDLASRRGLALEPGQRAAHPEPRRERIIAQNYPSIATDLLNPLLDVLGRSREACGGDVDKFLVLLVIAIRSAQHPGFKKLSYEQLLSGEIPVFPSLCTNVRSIAASLGMPKESVRRKVCELMSSGWVVRRGRDLFFTCEAHRQLAPVHESIERLALRNFDVVTACLSDLSPRP